jgi:hypothetical protein
VVGVSPWGLGSAAPAGVVAGGGQAHFPGLSATSTRRTLRKFHRAAVVLVLLLDGSTAGELLTELSRYAMQQLIKLEVAVVFGTDAMSAPRSGLAIATATGPPQPSPPKWGA